ncbi:MAG TPA: hypothetical protein VMB71_03785 [Acetobacteraceae bacterium]|nr:hypothetical protein [Acetobacteraceae bacterium]
MPEMTRKESSFSEEKEAKRLLSVGIWPRGRLRRGTKEQKFFASCFQKRRRSFFQDHAPGRLA